MKVWIQSVIRNPGLLFKGTIAHGDIKEMQTFKYLRVMFMSKGLSKDAILLFD